MADPTSPGLALPFDQSQLPDYLDASRKQMLAQMLMGNLQRTSQVPADWNSMKVVPRKSLLSNLAGLGTAAWAGQAIPDALKSQAQYNASLWQDPASAPPQQPGSAQVDPNSPTTQALQGYPQVSPGQGVNSPVGNGAAPASSPRSSPMVPPGGDPNVARRVWAGFGGNYQAYMEKYYLPIANGTPEWQNALRGANGNRAMAQQLMLMKLQNEGTLKLRPGETGYANGKAFATAQQNGVGFNYDDEGNPQAYSVPGYAEAMGTLKGAEKGAEVGNSLVEIKQQGGGTKTGYGKDVLGTAPGMRGTQANAFTPQAAPQQAPAMGLPAQTPPPGVSGLQSELPSQVAQPPTASRTPGGAAPAAAPAAPQQHFPKAAAQPKGPDPFPDAPMNPTYSGSGEPNIQDTIDQHKRGELKWAQRQKYNDEGNTATSQLVNIDTALAHAKGANFGPWATEATQLGGILHQLFPKTYDGKTATNSQIFGKNTVNLALTGAKSIYGPKMTGQEVVLQKNEASPSAQQTQEAAIALLNEAKITAQYKIQKQQDYKAYLASGHDPAEFETYYNGKEHSLQTYAWRHDTERQVKIAQDQGMNIRPEAFERLQKHPEWKAAFQKNYGYIPPGYE